MKRIIFPLMFAAMLVISVCAYARDVQNDLEASLIRLHIIAQSDSDYDQNIKLAVRDAVLNAVRGTGAENTEEFKNAAEIAANNYLEENNIPYRAKAEYGIFHFPEKRYMNIALPAGDYYGIRIILGSGAGHNWWCVMYPPLCVSGDDAYADSAAGAELESRLHADTYELISANTGAVRIKFKLLEILGI